MMEGGSPEGFAAMVALAVGLVKVIEKLVDGLLAKRKKPERHVVTLDAETTSVLKRLTEQTHEVHTTVTRVDGDGAPLVYSDKSTLGEVAEVLRDVSKLQERMIDRLDRVESRLDNVLRPTSRG